jgi:hypothetical protein
MADGAMMLRKGAVAGGPVAWAPGAPTGMAVGAQIAPPEPAAIATACLGTKVPRGVHHAGAALGRGHRCRWHWRRRVRRRGVLLAQGPRGLVRQAHKRGGLAGALAAWRDGQGGLRLGRRAWAGPGEGPHDTQPQESQDHELGGKVLGNHGHAPTQ